MENSEIVLVTGFGPFGEHKINASWEAVKLLPDNIEKYKIVKQEVPVIYTHVESVVPLLWKNHNPRLVIHVGVSGFTDKLLIETCANKSGYSRLDCNGLGHSTGNACGEGEDCIQTALNAQKICDNICQNNQNSFKVGTSCNAGRYLCEFIYYLSLNVDNRKTLFIHVPPLDKPYSAEILRDALLEIIKYSLIQLIDE